MARRYPRGTAVRTLGVALAITAMTACAAPTPERSPAAPASATVAAGPTALARIPQPRR